MKKYVILLSIFIISFAGIFIASKMLDKHFSIDSTSSDFTSVAGNSSSGSTTGDVLASMQGQATVHEVDKDLSGSVVDNPDGDGTNQSAIVIDGKFSSEDWENRRNAGITNETITSVMTECMGLYAYDSLSTEKKQLYAEILLLMRNRAVGVPICSIIPADVEKVSSCVLMDHPEIFYVDGYSYEKYMFAGNVQKIMYIANYTMNEDTISSMQQVIDQYVSTCLQGVSQSASDYEKVKYVYEYIIRNTEYNLEAPENQNICSVFVHRQSVCLGYAKAIQYLLQQLDVSVTVVTGSVETGEGHAWNLVKINGQYYYLDATWGDASYLMGSGTEGVLSSINYDYLCITTTELTKTHIIDNPVPVPLCVSVAENYYVKEGLYLAQIDSFKMQEIFKKAYNTGAKCVSIKCSSETVFRQVQTDLIDNQMIFNFLSNGTQTLAYTYNEKMYTYTFML